MKRNRGFVLELCLVIILLGLFPISASAQSFGQVDRVLNFRVLADGDPVGYDRFKFRRNGDELSVQRTIRIDLSWWFLNVASYRHDSNEVWRDNTLQSLESRTNYQGDVYKVRASRNNGTMVVTNRGQLSSETADLSADGPVFPTSWWNRSLIGAENILDSQYGRLLDLQVANRERTEVETSDGTRQATRYDLTGDLELSAWYGSDDALLKLQYRREGIVFVHQRSAANPGT